MTALLLLALSVVFSVLAWEVHGLRQTVRDRFARTNAELHTIEANLAVHRGILDGLETRSNMDSQLKLLNSMKGALDEISGVVCQSAETVDTESRLSKAMEEGVMNLMGYAAGKAGSGIEVGLG